MGKYTRLFIDESREYLAALRRILGASHEEGSVNPSLEEGCRLAHTIKGMALFEEQTSVADMALALEKGFRRGAAEGIGRSLLEGLRKGVGLLSVLIDEVERNGEGRSDPRPAIREIEREAGAG